MLSYCMTPTGGRWWVMWREMSWEQKGPFLPKLEDGSGSFFIFPPPSKKSKKTADTDRRGKYDLWWHHVLPKQICFEEDCFLWCVEIKKQWIFLKEYWFRFFSLLSPPPHSCFSFSTLSVFVGLNIDTSYRRWLNKLSSILKHRFFMWVDVMQE